MDTNFNEPQKREFTGVWMPAEILLDERLKPVDRILYAEIASFGSKGCWKKSEELMKRCGVKERAFRSACNRLEDNGYITQKRRFGRIFRTSSMSFKHQSQNSTDEQGYNSTDEQGYNSTVHIDNTKENTIDNTNVAKATDSSKMNQFNEDFKKMNDYWSKTANRKLSNNKTSKGAYKKLLKEHTNREIAEAIKYAVKFQGQEYKPQILSFASLYDKWDSLQGHISMSKPAVDNDHVMINGRPVLKVFLNRDED